MDRGGSGDFRVRETIGDVPPELPLHDLPVQSSDALPAPIGGDGWSAIGVRLNPAPLPSASDRLGEMMLVAFYPPDTEIPDLSREQIGDIRICAETLVPEPQSLPEHTPTLAALPGRLTSHEVLAERVTQAAEGEKPLSFGVVGLNLAHLAAMNERYGWDTADFLLDEVAGRILHILPAKSFFSHLGGGNFLIFTPLGTSAVGTRALITHLLGLTELAVSTASGPIPFALSIGWAMYPQDSDSPEGLLIATRAALAESTREDSGQEHRATTDMTARHKTASGLEQDLSHAIQDDTLFLKWMPIVEVTSRQIVGHEALLRWNRPGFGEVQPELFIQCAEGAGLVEQLDSWSLRSACKAALAWDESLRVCVNMSPLWLVRERMSKLVGETLRETGLDPHRLQIELSECKPFGPTPIAHREIARIRALGVHIALDDFGQGYASLERVSRFPIDQIKLDRSFMRDAGRNPRVDEVLCAVLRLARVLNISCCAKGVETEHQMAILDAYGCEEAQGFLLGAPAREATTLRDTTPPAGITP